jgi:hypothetical protein
VRFEKPNKEDETMSEPVHGNEPVYSAVPHLPLRMEVVKLIDGIREIEKMQAPALMDLTARQETARAQFEARVKVIADELLEPLRAEYDRLMSPFVEPKAKVVAEIERLMKSAPEAAGSLIWDHDDMDAARCCVSGLPLFTNDDVMANADTGLSVLAHVVRPDFDRIIGG